ncbi:hypothetical protein RJ639_039336 [Escallonia herrerae]|uniref:Retrovirus-related Pol polyprotein from transposon TNT 1-94-like beta-barrel domain-containing protein n=1 Tax=Escallonia herrerae TaxID=1293975 RepID=A0AA88WN06_9ASTE|nr:hypothetical protein RJ639_039336 [Escallonia herrerae]
MSHADVNSSGGEENGLNKEDIGRLRSLLDSLEKSKGTCSLTQSGKLHSSYALSASSSEFSNSWVIDSGATDHMTHSSHKFLTYHPCPSNRKIAIADGSLAIVAGQGNIVLSPSITLKNVLHDQVTRRTIGHARGDTSSMEDKDLFLREPSMLVKTSPVQTKSTPEVELNSRGDSEAEPIESFPYLSEEPSRPINPTLTMPLKVYSRRIKPVINPVQVQETESSLGNENFPQVGTVLMVKVADGGGGRCNCGIRGYDETVEGEKRASTAGHFTRFTFLTRKNAYMQDNQEPQFIVEMARHTLQNYNFIQFSASKDTSSSTSSSLTTSTSTASSPPSSRPAPSSRTSSTPTWSFFESKFNKGDTAVMLYYGYGAVKDSVQANLSCVGSEDFCVEHRSCKSHDCPKSDHNSQKVVVCETCSMSIETTGQDEEREKAVWRDKKSGDCDPKKKKKKPTCQVRRCREILTFSNTSTCKTC